MTVSKAQQRATAKYVKNNYDEMKIRIKKGSKALIETAAQANNESLNGYVKKAVKTQYKTDTGKDIDL